MKNTDKSQESLDIYRVRKLPEKIRIKTDRRNGDSYTTNEKEIKIIIKITKKENVLKN